MKEEIKKSLSRAYTVEQFKRKFCGEYLGSGVTREVYVFKPNPRYVVKIEYTNGFHNVLESEIWKEACSSKKDISSYLAPVYWIRNDGMIMLQRRVRHGRYKDYPPRMPNMFGDFKYKNYGWIGDQFVCCDYSGLALFYDGRLRKAEWWKYSNDILGKRKTINNEQSSIKKGNKRKKQRAV